MPSFAPVLEILAAAADDGHTVIGEDVLVAMLAGRGLTRDAATAAIAAAIAEGEVVTVPAAEAPSGVSTPATGPRLLCCARHAAAEEAIATAVTELAAADALIVVDAPAEAGRRAAAELRATDVHVITDAHDLDVLAAATALGAAPRDTPVALVGDGGLPPPAGPGKVFLNLLDAAATLDVPVERHTVDDTDPIGALCDRIRAGRLPPIPDEPSRRIVVVPAADGLAAAHRARQLVTDSIPRVFGLGGDDVAVLSPIRRGPGGVDALRAAGLPAHPVSAARRRQWPAVVAVLPPESCGLLSRPLVYAMFRAAAQHLSIVHAAGPALAHAVRTVGARPRRTRLPALLSASAPSEPVSASSVVEVGP